MRPALPVLVLFGVLPLLGACAGDTLTGGLSRVGLPVRLDDAVTGEDVAAKDARLVALLSDARARLAAELPEGFAARAAAAAGAAELPVDEVRLVWSDAPRRDMPIASGSRTVYYELVPGRFRRGVAFLGHVQVHLVDLADTPPDAESPAAFQIELSMDFEARDGTYRLAPDLADRLADDARGIVVECAAAHGLSATVTPG
ncbi:MAG: hypothetical protein ACYTG2_01080 [Planctomycetota bacterium]|jgi:hypothetical protein